MTKTKRSYADPTSKRRNATASQQAKAAGLKNLAVVVDMTGASYQTLLNWHKNKPELFRIVLLGCVAEIGT